MKSQPSSTGIEKPDPNSVVSVTDQYLTDEQKRLLILRKAKEDVEANSRPIWLFTQLRKPPCLIISLLITLSIYAVMVYILFANNLLSAEPTKPNDYFLWDNQETQVYFVERKFQDLQKVYFPRIQSTFIESGILSKDFLTYNLFLSRNPLTNLQALSEGQSYYDIEDVTKANSTKRNITALN
jgi:hypothetical protein